MSEQKNAPICSPALAGKRFAMNTAAFFEKHRARADRTTFRRILSRKGGEAQRHGDELK